MRRWLVAVAWFVGLTFAVSDAFWASAFSWWEAAPRAALAVISWAAMLALVLRGDERGGRAIWWAAACLTPLIAAYAAFPWAMSLPGNGWGMARMPDPLTRWVAETPAPDAHVFVFAPVSLLVGFAGTFGPRKLRAMAWAAVLTCGFLAFAGAAQALRRPSPHAYVHSLVPAELRFVGEQRAGNFPNERQLARARIDRILGATSAVPEVPNTVPGFSQDVVAPGLPDAVGQLTCIDEPAYGSTPRQRLCTVTWSGNVRAVALWRPPEPPPTLLIRVDRRADVGFLVSNGETVALTDGKGWQQWNPRHWHVLAAHLAPTSGALALLTIGTVLAGVLALWRRYEASIAVALLSATPLAVWVGLILR